MFFSIDHFQHVHDLHDLVRPSSCFLETAILLTTETSARNYNVIVLRHICEVYVLCFKVFPYITARG